MTMSAANRCDGHRLRSLLICHRDAILDRDGLSSWMASFSDLVGIVELREPPARTWQRVRNQVARAGVWRFLDVLGLRLFYRLMHARGDREWEAGTVASIRERFGEPPPGCRILRARSVNALETARFIQGCAPDFVLARCKTIMTPDVFTIPTRGTYVLHPGICPEYRNAHGCFWALAARDLDRVGLTLLRVDVGVDTGPVYGYFTYPFDERSDSHIRIQQRVLTDNLDAVRDRLLLAVEGAIAPIDTTGRRTAVWGMPWLTAYLRWKATARMNRDDAANAALSRRGA
jgi:Formyl transferase